MPKNNVNSLNDRRSLADDNQGPLNAQFANISLKNCMRAADEIRLDADHKNYKNITSISKICINSTDIGIIARVTRKDRIHEYNTCPGTGTVTSVTVMDSSEVPNNEIRLTMFGDRIDHYYGSLDEGKVYYFKGCDAKSSFRNNNLAHKCELTLRRGGVVEPAPDDKMIQLNSYNFDLIEIIRKKNENDLLDV